MKAWPWAAASLVVVVGWASGYSLWAQGDPAGFYREPFDMFVPLLTVAFGLPFSLVAGRLTVSARRSTRLAGYAALCLEVVALAYIGSFAFFGGICLDPGKDYCVTTWPTRIAVLGAALLSLAAGAALAAWRGRTAAT